MVYISHRKYDLLLRANAALLIDNSELTQPHAQLLPYFSHWTATLDRHADLDFSSTKVRTHHISHVLRRLVLMLD